MSKATITFYKPRNVNRDDLFSEELHAVNNAGQRFRSADKFRRIPVFAGRHEIGALLEVREHSYRFYIAVAADMTGFEFALSFAAPCDETKALSAQLDGFKHSSWGRNALRSVKSAVKLHFLTEQINAWEPVDEDAHQAKIDETAAMIERFNAICEAQAETVEVEEPAQVETVEEAAQAGKVQFGPFEYEGDGAHSSELTRAGECVGELVRECGTGGYGGDRRVACYRVRSWSGEVDRAFSVSAHGTAREALKAARQFAQTMQGTATVQKSDTATQSMSFYG